MSHLTLDARAILAYLNELGYRNISAEQLREFMKGMQPQSDIDSNNKQTAATTTQQSLPTTAAPTTATNQQQNRKHHHHHRSPKIIKGKKPLIHFTFYLDIRDHQLTKTIEEKITSLGGCLEFFLTPSITHFVTDKQVCSKNNNNNNNTPSLGRPLTPQTPVTPGTPHTPYSYEQSPCESTKNAGSGTAAIGSATTTKKQSRADAMLNRARRPSTTHTSAIYENSNNNNNNTSNKNNPNLKIATPNYIIWSTEYALRFFKRISHDLKDYLEGSAKKLNGGKPSGTVEPISLKGGFIKIEAIKRSQRPYYQLFRKPTEWPKIELNREDGAFRLSPKRKPQPGGVDLVDLEPIKMTRKSRSRSSQNRATTKELKKSAADVGVTKSSNGRLQPHSTNAEVGAAAVCKQLKESSEKQCGVCEICKIEYDTLTIHLKTKDHEYFAKNTQNFIALDTLIHASADVNKFLDANKALEVKSELEEEMEVVEDVASLDTDAADPLEDHQPSQIQEKRRSAGYTHKTPSPSLREKSKRSTKGKHSSEKFQNICGAKMSRSTSLSPQKKTSSACSSKLELQAFKNEPAKMTPAPPATTRKKPAPASVISPPIRAMLPPSSLYKVVETTLVQDGCSTPPRKQRDTGETAAIVASPSLIVKFKKVRQTELTRLHGEAENFMFPRRRTSSELPTDQDRQTTSENALRASASSTSISLDSTSEQQVDQLISEDIENNEHAIIVKPENKSTAKRPIVVAKRRKGRPSGKQSFPRAPIQPEEFTLKSLLQTPGTTKTDAAANEKMVATSLTLPEATRKSSRTATAIVTAATTSSRLLRAAVEAAKNNQRLSNDSSYRRRSSATPSKTMVMKTTTTSAATAGKQIKRPAQTATVVKLEDRMGDDTEEESHRANSINYEVKKMKNVYIDDDDDDDDIDSDDEEDDYDDDDDEDYVGNFRAYDIKTQLPTIAASRQKRFSSNNRDQRAANRATKPCIKLEAASIASSDDDDDDNDYEDDDDDDYVCDDIVVDEKPSKPKTKKTPKPKPKSKPKPKLSPVKRKSLPTAEVSIAPQSSYSAPSSSNSAPQKTFDISKSERFQDHQYAFERVPAEDLWFRVFNRQDACEEQFFEYYGSTNYRKLPYELGPIPFNRTLDGISCKLCRVAGEGAAATTSTNAGKKTGSDVEVKNKKSKPKAEPVSGSAKATTDATATSTTAPSSPTLFGTASSSSNYTHKKLHLLQRYRREQQELLQKQQADLLQKMPTTLKTTASFPSKASTPDREAHERRAGSIHSNASSCASSTDTTYSKKCPRNKHLNKAAFLSLELPPRKSPREHASTLALVSCLIKQRQNSQSKPNSETDEPTENTPTPPVNCVEEDTMAIRKQQSPPPISTPAAASAPPAIDTSLALRSTRSAAGTPVEEIRFATEISENVKRLRRGQNKYNHSPTIDPTGRASVTNVPVTQERQDTPSIKLKRRRRQPSKYHSYTSVVTKGKKPSIRKTGSKKGVLEFEVDAAALKALDTSREYTNVRLLEWQIDKYLEYAGRTLDFDAQESEFISKNAEAKPSVKDSKRSAKNSKVAAATDATNTPPATDYFSSDFDLYDLFTSTPTKASSADKEQCSEKQQTGSKKAFSLYSSVALQNYFKKRKSLKSNRTGWPKVQKKKSSVRQQQQLTDKIRFLQPISEKQDMVEGLVVKSGDGVDSGEDQAKEQTARQSVVITPPDSDDIDDDDNEEEDEDDNGQDDEDECKTVDNDTEIDVAESIPEEEDYADTMADDSVDDRQADVEEEDDDEEGDEAVTAEDEDQMEDEAADDEDTLVNYEPPIKKARRATAVSPVEKLSHTTNITVSNLVASASANATSTPSTQLLRSLRRSTPHLNGSLGSCVSPSEKAGDNSDIFTVSSDGLDTDLDLSNSHSALLKTGGGEEHETHCVNYTPKRKFDLAKYAASNNAAATSTCAAEAATVNAKSLAISQFLKKEVKVTCRRLRAPFRRFRYRR